MSVEDNYKKVYGLSLANSTKETNEERLNDLTEALNKISKAAQSCGVSMQEMVAATNAFARMGMDLSTSAGAALKEVSNRMKEESYRETVKEYERQVENKQPDFDIPRVDLSAYKVEIDDTLFNFDFKPYNIY